MNIEFVRVREVEVPRRASGEEAGIDFYIPKINHKLIEDINKNNILHGRHYTVLAHSFDDIIKIELFKGGRILIPSGIKVFLPHGTCLQVNNKSGRSTKDGLIFTAQVIDSTYYGEVHLGVANIGNNSVFLESNQKLLQMLHLPILLTEPLEIGEDEYEDLIKSRPSSRMDLGFGSDFEKHLKQK